MISGPHPHAQLLLFGRRRRTQLQAQPQPASSTTDDDSNNQQQQQQRAAVAVLATVPVAWGTFEVAVRYVYALPELPFRPLCFRSRIIRWPRRP